MVSGQHQVGAFTANDSDRQCSPHCRDLEGISHDVFHELEKDVAVAHKASKPLLSIFKRRGGKVRFAITRKGSSLLKELERCSYRPSAVNSDNRSLTVEMLRGVFDRLRNAAGVRVNVLEDKTADTADGEETYFIYHIDMEAA